MLRFVAFALLISSGLATPKQFETSCELDKPRQGKQIASTFSADFRTTIDKCCWQSLIAQGSFKQILKEAGIILKPSNCALHTITWKTQIPLSLRKSLCHCVPPSVCDAARKRHFLFSIDRVYDSRRTPLALTARLVFSLIIYTYSFDDFPSKI